MRTIHRFKVIWAVTWVLSGFSLISGLVFSHDPNVSDLSKLYSSILIQAGGAFFFALTVGWIVERLRDKEGYSVLWLFSQEFRKAGVLSYYSDRKGNAETELMSAFQKHNSGDILMVGASLRLFLSPGAHFYSTIRDMLLREEKRSIAVKALYCSLESNRELPIRSFVEEFNQNMTTPKSNAAFNWNKNIEFSFEEFEKNFYGNYGPDAGDNSCRVVHDLNATRKGIIELSGAIEKSGNAILHREFRSAPYCTAIIFPDKAFYTPNLLSTFVPANLPMTVFHKSSYVYERLVDYFNFLWWINCKIPSEEH